jgi:hypothetical protein
LIVQMANPRGQQRDKPFLAALRLEIAEAGGDPKRLRRIAKRLLAKAEEGDVQAIREVADRLDGKVPQAISGEDGTPVSVRFVIESAPAQ